MRGSLRRVVGPLLLSLGFVCFLAAAAHGKSHCWKFTEFFSNADGSIQFIEWQEACTPPGEAEWQTLNEPVASNAGVFLLDKNLDDNTNTADTWMLAATQSFADLPGAPTPDFLMPEGFIDPGGDTIRYRTTLDIVTLPPGLMLTNGVTSVHRNPETGELSTGPNNPINFAGEVGFVTVTSVPAIGPLGLAALAALGMLLGVRRLRRKGV
jgi:hypothetical protein